jgi:hypothetical protein
MSTTLLQPAPAADKTLFVHLLLAEPEPETRAELTELATAEVDGLVVLMAPDGAEAIRLGLHYGPALGVIDLGMPMGGLGAAVTLRELRPAMRLAVHSRDKEAFRDGARRLGLPFFGRTERGALVDWISTECAALRSDGVPTDRRGRHGYVCAECGYGVSRRVPPDHCPMCRLERWTPEPWRPFSRRAI